MGILMMKSWNNIVTIKQIKYILVGKHRYYIVTSTWWVIDISYVASLLSNKYTAREEESEACPFMVQSNMHPRKQ